MEIYEVALCQHGRWEQQHARFVAARDADEAAYKVTGEHLRSEGERRKLRLRVKRLGNGSPPPKLFTPLDPQCWVADDCRRADQTRPTSAATADAIAGLLRLVPMRS